MNHLIYVPKLKEATIKRDGINVVVIMEGKKVADLPWDAALMLSRAIRIQARRIEEEVKALGIIDDQALLIRSGAPFGLTSHPGILREAVKEAVHNPKLRKYVTGERVKMGGSVVGEPTVICHEPK